MTYKEKREFNLLCAGIMGYDKPPTRVYSPADDMNLLAEVFDKVWATCYQKHEDHFIYFIQNEMDRFQGSGKGIRQAMIDFIQKAGESK